MKQNVESSGSEFFIKIWLNYKQNVYNGRDAKMFNHSSITEYFITKQCFRSICVQTYRI